MNKLILLGAVMFCTLRIEAQSIKKRDVPPAVITGFSALYPNASKVKWENEDGMYEGSFLIAKKETSLLFSRDGILVQTENEIAIADLPSGVTEYVSKNYPSATIEEATKVTDIEGNVNYEIEAASFDILFSSTGQMLSQEKEDDEEDDEEDD
ncbi:MAG: PepSY-like domain-containing protein, partial [Saprospiraceae bacterium]|nr:PepSY-like domain-containing protein [Saprospiraceae bacterium]